MSSTYQERRTTWELTGICKCRRVDRVPMYAIATREEPGEAWDTCAVCGKTWEQDAAVDLVRVHDRGLVWAIPGGAGWMVEYRPFYGNEQSRFMGDFETFEAAVECARNYYTGLVVEQPIAVWLYHPTAVELDQEILV